jgi:hypothetical protein
VKKIIVLIAALFIFIGGIAVAQEAQDAKEYVADAASVQLTPEELSEMEGEFYYNPKTTNQYTPNVQRMAVFTIIEGIQEGLIKVD